MHWGVYSVPEQGEWYARKMYQEGSAQYKHHLLNYGHPSKFGYKDLVPLWKAESFDPNSLLALFKKAGARYFCPCATHHDNFDLWDSQHNRWNAVNMGPKRDIIGEFRAATLEHNLRFGVTTHLERSWSWLQVNKRSDKKGPLAGVPYDGNIKAFQDFYLKPDPAGDDNQAHPRNAPPEWRKHWKLRIQDLIEKYRPDHLYVDGGVPFYGDDQGQTGLELIAHYYNFNAKLHGGRNEGVMCVKNWLDRHPGGEWGYFWEGIATQDFERGKAKKIFELPWQTDDSIGPWGYQKNAKYQSVTQLVHKLVDIVSKNGNLLLNVPPRADGTLDERTIAILEGIGRWLSINGEAIYGTRPYKVFGEGDSIRFTTKGKTLYAILLNWPGETVKIDSLAGHSVLRVSLVGLEETLDHEMTEDSLVVSVPSKKRIQHAWVLRIE